MSGVLRAPEIKRALARSEERLISAHDGREKKGGKGAGEATMTANFELLPECVARGGVVRCDYNSATIASQRILALVSRRAAAYTAR